MGTDIHCFVEKFNYEEDKWEQVTGFISDMYEPNRNYFSEDRFKDATSPIDGRNYNLFAMLADVRNGFGFAGVDTGDRIEPISYPKGLPEDISEEVLKEAEEVMIDSHSHSWLTLREILDYDKSKKKVHRGFVTTDVYKKFLEDGDPYPCCGGVGGERVLIVDKNEKDPIKVQEENPDKTVYCQIEWTERVEEFATLFYEHSIPQLKIISDSDNFDDVRIVFWFDN